MRTRRETRAEERGEAGFTLVEMIVAIALFAIVMVVAVGALLSLTAADRKAQALQSVMNNLNISLDSMVRNIRMGRDYHCGTGAFVGNGSDDCTSSGTEVSFACNQDSSTCTPGSRWAYAYDANGSICGQAHAICKSEQGGNAGTWSPITASEVQVQNMAFYVVGTLPGDEVQPKVILVVTGQAGAGSATTQTTFHIQATAEQRELDL